MYVYYYIYQIPLYCAYIYYIAYCVFGKYSECQKKEYNNILGISGRHIYIFTLSIEYFQLYIFFGVEPKHFLGAALKVFHWVQM